MSRMLLAWELGSNLGHLSRLLPLASRLKERGHEVLVSARDLGLATELLAAVGIPFVQSPADGRARPFPRQPQSYADVLLMQGWESMPRLWGLVQAWGNLFRLFRPGALLLDYAPTALLAARILRLPCALLGTGFELPPLEVPLGPFPGFEDVSAKNATAADAQALQSANRVLEAYQATPLTSLCDLFRTERRWLTTFAELDQYGPRPQEIYVGPIGTVDRGEPVKWPQGFRHRVLAYLRPGIADPVRILRALSEEKDAAVICAAPGMPPEISEGLARPGFQFVPRPVNFQALLSQASVFVSYAPAGSVTQALLAGVPQLMVPMHVEAQMTAVRVESLGAGLMLRGEATEREIAAALRRVLDERCFKVRALVFASRHRAFDRAAACDRIVAEIERLAAGEASQRPQSARAG
jgi:UDP-N-acetylglucosamine:LPS N-acetylglucosamine transferase